MKRIKNLLQTFRDLRFQNRLLALSNKGNSIGHVLMFHNVTDEIVDSPSSCMCSVSLFKRTLDKYHEEGFKFVSLDDAIDMLERDERGCFVSVTFDDIPDNVYNAAYPILKQLQIPFTVFVSNAFINKAGMISEEQLFEMDSDPLCTIGAHSLTHVNFGTINDCSKEIQGSKIELENLLGHPIRYFAYPFGSISAVPTQASKIAEETGYAAAFSAVPAPLTKAILNERRWFLPRIVANQGVVAVFKRQSFISYLFSKIHK